MIDKKKKIKSIIAIIILVVIVSTATFAYFGTFSANLTNNVSVNISSSSPGDTTFTTSSAVLELNVPSESMFETNANDNEAVASNSAVLNVSLIGTSSNVSTICTYDIVFEYDTSSNVYGISPTTKTSGIDKEITFEVSSPSGTNHFQTEKNIDYNTSNGWIASTSTTGAKITLVSDATISISKGLTTTQSYTVTARYYNLSTFQGQLAGKSFAGKIYVDPNYDCVTEELKGYETILTQNGGREAIEAKGTPDFSLVATTNEGLYKAQDDLGTSYYFRGAVNNNWVQFGKEGDKDIYWRIIRINGDGSIRMIYSGTTDPSTVSSVIESKGVYMTGKGTQISTPAFNSSYDKAEHVGYQYIEGQQHGYGKCNGTSASCTVNENTVYNSTIKQAIDKWYAGTTLKDNDLIADQIFCNDRSASTTQTAAWTSTGATYLYGAYGRLTQTTKSPQLTCPTASDKFTVNTSNGNGALTYPVGLITADEVAMAGGRQDSDNSSYYLYTNQYYWSGSPYYFNGDYSFTYEFRVSDFGIVGLLRVDSSYGARPVVSLSSKAKLSGSGTYDDVYVVVE